MHTRAGWQALGWVSRHAPRGRNRVAGLVRARAGGHEVPFLDSNGHRRWARLGDQLESQWFAGVPVGLPSTVRTLLRPGWRAIDVGANVGIVAGQLALGVGRAGRVDCFEPVPGNVRRLRQLVADNPLDHVHVWGTAVGRAEGRLTLRLPAACNSGWASISASWNDAGLLDVPVTTLDRAILDSGVPRVDFVKIDVEGSEFDVLTGGARVWREQAPLVLMECNDPLLRDAGASSQSLLAAAADCGYRPVDPVPAAALEGAVVDVLLESRSARR